jgi:hypothetical protein
VKLIEGVDYVGVTGGFDFGSGHEIWGESGCFVRDLGGFRVTNRGA